MRNRNLLIVTTLTITLSLVLLYGYEHNPKTVYAQQPKEETKALSLTEEEKAKAEMGARLEDIELPTPAIITKKFNKARKLYNEEDMEAAFQAFEETQRMANILANIVNIFNEKYKNQAYKSAEENNRFYNMGIRGSKVENQREPLETAHGKVWKKTDSLRNRYLSLRNECWYYQGLIHKATGDTKRALNEFIAVCQYELVDNALFVKAKREIQKILALPHF